MWAGTPRFWASSSLSITRASSTRSSPLRAQRSNRSFLFMAGLLPTSIL
ncbi:MAG: hypothetical protein V8S34_02870 [Lawsonibacter sp.]